MNSITALILTFFLFNSSASLEAEIAFEDPPISIKGKVIDKTTPDRNAAAFRSGVVLSITLPLMEMGGSSKAISASREAEELKRKNVNIRAVIEFIAITCLL